MSFIATKSKFHVALDGCGLLLQGSPNAPAYKMFNTPVYGTRFASGDRSYNDLSQWWYLTQTDWSGGIKDFASFEDDAKYYYSSNIDSYSKEGYLQLEKALTLFYNNNVGGNDEIWGVDTFSYVNSSGNMNTQSVFVTNEDAKLMDTPTVHLFDSSTQTNLIFSHRGVIFSLGSRTIYSDATASFPITNEVYIENEIETCLGIANGTLAYSGGHVAIGDTLYLFGTTDYGTVWCVKTTTRLPTAAANWTKVFDFTPVDSYGIYVAGATLVGSEILFLTTAQTSWGLYSLDVTSGVITLVKSFDNGCQLGAHKNGSRYLQPFAGGALLTLNTVDPSTSGFGEIWFYDGSTITLKYKSDSEKNAFSTKEAVPFLDGGCVIYDNKAYWGNLICDTNFNFYNFVKTIDDAVAPLLHPVGTDGDYLYLVDNTTLGEDTMTQLYKYNSRGTVYKAGASNSAFLVFSQHDKLQSIDKLLNTITIGFKKFLTGQAINVYYTTAQVPDPVIATGGWVLLGSASYALDGADAVFKTLPFAVGTTAKKIWFRVELVSATAGTPALADFTLEYLPVPNYKKEWKMNINCGDEVKMLDGRLVETTARELKSRLEKMWWTKSALDYQDVDYASTLLNDATLTATATTLTVDSTVDFPEQGRIRLDDEEILYTGKSPTTFTGCTRGARGSRAATHADDCVVNNAYRVLVMSIEEVIPILLKDKQLEYVVTLDLREV